MKIACERCSLAGFCLPFGLSQDEIQSLDSVIQKRKILHQDDVLTQQNQQFDYLYAVRSGTLKSVQQQENGALLTVNFHFPGELIGFEAIHPGKYQSRCVALDTSSVCVISYNKLLELSQHVPSLNQQVLNLLSENIVSNHVYNIHDTADERLAKFILNISTRMKRAGSSGSHFILPMAKQDIANYLGLANETLSRIFKKMIKSAILTLNKREMEVLDFRKLQHIACGT